MALVAVLLVVAALSVLVTGVVQGQRAELRLAGVARSTLLGEAAGQAAIHLVLQRMTAGADRTSRLTRVAVNYDHRDMVVEVMPLTGLVDLNQAPGPLLTAFLTTVGGAEPGLARTIADALVARRQAAGAQAGPPAPLTSPEELLSLPGADYDLFARIAGLVTTDSRGGGRINPLAAPLEVLSFLAMENAALARRIAADRDAGVVAIDTTRLEGAFIDATVSSRYRFTAHVPLPDGSHVKVTRDIDIASEPSAAAPWQTLRSTARWVAAARAGS